MMSNFFFHPTSVVDDNVVIGSGTKVWHFSHIQSGARIGENCSFGQNVNLSNNVIIGNGVKVHRKDCKFILDTSERILVVSWNDDGSLKYNVVIKVYIDSSNDRLVDILTLATKSDINVSSINNKGVIKNEDVYDLICKVKNKESLDRFISELSSFSFVSKVER